MIFCIDRAGLVGEDGATHHGMFDLAYLSPIPNLIIAAPSDIVMLRNMMYTAYVHRDQPFAIRYPRGKGETSHWQLPFEEVEIGKAKMLVPGEKVAVLSIGSIARNVSAALKIVEEKGYHPAHVDMRFLAPIDEEMMAQIMKEYSTIVTVEDGIEQGGLFSSVAERVVRSGQDCSVVPIAIRGHFVEQGDVRSLQQEQGLSPEQIAEIILQQFNRPT